MATLVDLASRYRWELMLIIGIPVVNHMSRWLLITILANFNLSLADWFCSPHFSCSPDYVPTFFNIWLLLLLGFLYLHVRRSGRTALTLLWAYAFVSMAVGTFISLPYQAMDPEWWSRAPWSWLDDIQTYVHLFILMWFARQASRISFSHAIVLIGLSNFLFEFGLVMLNLVFLPLEGRAGAWDIAGGSLVATLFALWVLARLDVPKEKHDTDIERWVGCLYIPVVGVPLRRLAAWALPRFDPARGINKELLIALFGLHWLLHAYLSLRYLVVYDFEPARFMMIVLYVFVYPPLWIVLVILLAYGIRARQPTEGPGTIEPKAEPTKPFLCPSYGSQEKHPIS